MATVFEVSEKLFEISMTTFEKQLMTQIEYLAKLVIGTNERAKSFTMGMGSASFHCQWTEVEGGDSWSMDDHLSPDEIASENCYAKQIDQILMKWDDVFRLTGNPLKITIDPVSGEIVTTTDW